MRSLGFICPLRPSIAADGTDPMLEEDGWRTLDDADVLVEPNAPLIGAAIPEDETAEDGEVEVQVPVGMPEQEGG